MNRKPELGYKLSVIIPLYNGLPYFKKTIDSILDQTYDLTRVQVVVVEHDSTDGSAAYVDQVAEKHPGLFTVLHKKGINGPAKARNEGIEVAQGEFIFFCDADDYFGVDAFTRMLGHAEAWNSDVLLVKIASVNGRDIPRSMFRCDQPKADVYTSNVFNSLGPWKLIKRSLVEALQARFHEGIAFREDEAFTAQLLLAARVISVAADYDYYHLVDVADKSNLSSMKQCDFSQDKETLSSLLRIVDEYADVARSHKKVLPRILRSSFCSALVSASSINNELERERAYRELYEVVKPCLNEKTISNLPPALRIASDALRAGDSQFISNFISSVRTTPNGSYDGYELTSRNVFIDDDGKAWLLVTIGPSAYSTEVTKNLPLKYDVRSIAVSEEGMDLEIELQRNDFWNEETIGGLVLARGKQEVIVPLGKARVEEKSILYVGRVEFTAEPFKHTGESKVSLHFDCGILGKSVRFGPTLGSDVANALDGAILREHSSDHDRISAEFTAGGGLSIVVGVSPPSNKLVELTRSKQELNIRGAWLSGKQWPKATKVELALVADDDWAKAVYYPVESIESDNAWVSWKALINFGDGRLRSYCVKKYFPSLVFINGKVEKTVRLGPQAIDSCKKAMADEVITLPLHKVEYRFYYSKADGLCIAVRKMGFFDRLGVRQ